MARTTSAQPMWAGGFPELEWVGCIDRRAATHPEKHVGTAALHVDAPSGRVDDVMVGELKVESDRVAFPRDKHARPIVRVNGSLVPVVWEVGLRRRHHVQHTPNKICKSPARWCASSDPRLKNKPVCSPSIVIPSALRTHE